MTIHLVKSVLPQQFPAETPMTGSEGFGIIGLGNGVRNKDARGYPCRPARISPSWAALP